MAEVSVREVDSIIQNLVSLKDDIRELKQEVKDFILQMEHRLDNLDELLQVHNGRMDDFKLKQVKADVELKAWIAAKEKDEEQRKYYIELRQKRLAWIIPLVAVLISAGVSLLIKLF